MFVFTCDRVDVVTKFVCSAKIGRIRKFLFPSESACKRPPGQSKCLFPRFVKGLVFHFCVQLGQSGFRFIGGDVVGIGAPFSLAHVPSPIIAHDLYVSGHVVEASLLAVPLGSVADML